MDMQPRSLMRDIEQRIEELRSDIFAGAGRFAACDLVDETDTYVLTVDLPGIAKEEIRLDIDPRGAHVHAEHKEDRKEERKGMVRHERSARAFDRYVSFPQEVSADGASARFQNGVLEVRVPKVAIERRSARTVEIS